MRKPIIIPKKTPRELENDNLILQLDKIKKIIKENPYKNNYGEFTKTGLVFGDKKWDSVFGFGESRPSRNDIEETSKSESVLYAKLDQDQFKIQETGTIFKDVTGR